MRAPESRPAELVSGLPTTTDGVSGQPAQAVQGTVGTAVQPTVPDVAPLHKTQTEHQQAAHSAQHNSSAAHSEAKALPVLPWMRVPISIEEGTGVPLQQVVGLHPLALATLQTGMHYTPDTVKGCPALAI